MSSTYSIIRFFKNMCTVYRRGQMKLECTLLGTIASCHNRRRQSLHFSSSLQRISALTFNFWQQIPLLMSPNVRLEPSLFGPRHRVNPFNQNGLIYPFTNKERLTYGRQICKLMDGCIVQYFQAHFTYTTHYTAILQQTYLIYFSDFT